MQNCHMLFRSALLGSALASVALIAAAGASELRADMKRELAATGKLSSVSHSSSVPGAAHAPKGYKVVYSFAGPPNDGAGPTAEVTLDNTGNIFGTTGFGGTNGAGVLFKLKGKKDSILHSFGGTGDGSNPDGAVAIDSSGNIFGTTQAGGANSDGTIFEYAADGTYTVAHDFTSDEGSFIRGRLIQDNSGNFYGTALFGGTPGYGTVFEYSVKNGLTVLHAFNNTDGEYPEHGVVMDKSGNLFGVTAFGGSSGEGTVYEIAKDGTFSTLYNFTGGADGGFLYGGLGIDKKGNLYGNTASGGTSGNGTVFKLTPNGTFTTLYTFMGGTDGGEPEGDALIVGKNIYSTTALGGDPDCGCGGVYEVSAKGNEKMLQNFSGTVGDGYSAGMTPSGKTLYGTTAGGGADAGGVVFSLKAK